VASAAVLVDRRLRAGETARRHCGVGGLAYRGARSGPEHRRVGIGDRGVGRAAVLRRARAGLDRLVEHRRAGGVGRLAAVAARLLAEGAARAIDSGAEARARIGAGARVGGGLAARLEDRDVRGAAVTAATATDGRVVAAARGEGRRWTDDAQSKEDSTHGDT